ncbi:mycofactocin system FadH/OYE family oxidoreductase 1 [Tomitella fengzijianii]|uniref:Mycofactocin system FadH/OYE family oxidoreductase 1 n=1 Tax=Tomitella fengzijianii TaxID=2597660 RepID=A0A516X1N5_9ACTN|nr:mycofactocin system FadH/OYE family oxidoreductase 1 [Tomitella fengzijianii]QDQ96937.1 mycofactocin system FadH/OYE family oxidoreductase 1 [Tomitella fengzijianii]
MHDDEPARPASAARVRLAARGPLAGRLPPSAALLGPHVTNLGEGRALSPAHAAYYAERAAGGAGIVVTETASVHPSDWPYERAPLAAECADGWARIAGACRPHGTLVLAGLGHRGMQGSSAYGDRRALWGPSAVADPAGREMPVVMERGEIGAVVAGFADSARLATGAGCDGVEVDAGPTSLLRQFLSNLTNHRTDAYGEDRAALLLEVLGAVREAVGDAVVALRLSCDEAVAWGGITPGGAADVVRRAADIADLITVVRGGLYTVDAYRPVALPPWAQEHARFDTAPGFNAGLCRAMRSAAGGRAVVALQGSVTDPAAAQGFLADGTADVVEMTRALIADPQLVTSARAGAPHRPCLLCNQACMVDDPRNPLVDCVVRPRPADDGGAVGLGEPRVVPRRALIVGAGPAGLTAAREFASHGAEVTVVERAPRPGGTLRVAAAARPRLALFADWLEAECARLGVAIECGVDDGAERAAAAAASGVHVVRASGSAPRPAGFPWGWWTDAGVLLRRAVAPDGPVLVWDPIGGPMGIAVTEWLAGRGVDVGIVTPDPVVGADLARAGDLVGVNVRLQRAGVMRHVYSHIRSQESGAAVVENRHTGERAEVECGLVVDCSPGLPGTVLGGEADGYAWIGDCVAPRTVLEAVRDGEEAAKTVIARRREGGGGRGQDRDGGRHSPVGNPPS